MFFICKIYFLLFCCGGGGVFGFGSVVLFLIFPFIKPSVIGFYLTVLSNPSVAFFLTCHKTTQ
ncbi:hypothetical protein LEP1GSC060_3633 [Leptospira weilii serovar Ranarum str. ICFT]|uniref:Uncharacterized protein n=1 Tax=Leptospira weilii serovar Ranarum str. ICFT TaxID=1218598 RepID=N1WTK3_9LEPT|nr:hypothetical protein LEP1GSC060_3633 [Leptospira weilii serovar Ranarum str. ICFT]